MTGHEPSISTEEQLALAVEALSEHVVLFDAEDRVVLANKAWRELNKEVAAFTEPGTRFEDHLRALLEAGQVPEAEGRGEEWLRERMERHRNPSGPFEVSRQDGRWIRVHEQRLPNNGTILIIRDITEQKNAEQALVDSERKFRNLFENATSGIGRTRIKDGKVLLANAKFAAMFGYGSTEEFMAEFKFSDHYPTEDSRRKTLENYEKYPDKIHEVTFTKRDGSLIFTEAEVRIDKEQGVIDFVIIDVSERRRAQSALLESEQNYRLLFENAAVGIGRSRVKDGKTTIANQKLAEMFGYDSPEAFISEYDFVDGCIEKDQRARLISSLEKNPVQISEQKFTKRDGSIVTVLGYDKLHPSGEWIDYIAIDITDRMRAEQAVSESDALLSDAIESISEAFILYDADRRFVRCNSKYLDFYPALADVLKPGAKFEDVVRTAYEVGAVQVPAVTADEWVEKLTTQHRAAMGSHEQHLADGRWVLCSERRTSTGGTVGIRTDITERKRAEEALRESEERFSLAMRGANDGVWDWNLKTDDVYYSPRWCSMLGYEPEELAPNLDTWARLVAPADKERVLALVQDYISGAADAFETEFKMRHKNGSWVMILSRAYLVKEDGQAVRLVGTHVDISLRKQLEEQIRQAQKMEAVGQLTGGVAHDFNNLLAVILGNMERLEQQLDPDRREVAAIFRATERGAELTQRLLAFSRQQPLRPQPIDPAGLIAGMQELLTRTLGETIEIETVVGAGSWPATADPGQLENALLNLAINARDAMANGGKLIIECRNSRIDAAYRVQNPEAAEGEFVMLAVTDTGEGMAEEVRARAFEPFFTTKEVGKGSGLGLSMVYGFAKQSGGHVSIYSELGRGTTVKLYLPRSVTASRSDVAAPVEEIPLGRGQTVLVIEDDPDVRELAVKIVENLGYRAIAAAEATAAREIFESGAAIDVVLSDVVLPGGMSGPEFAEEFRAHAPGLPVIFMSGYPAEAAKRNGVLGSDKVLLNKPFRQHQLAEALRDALDR